MALELYNKEWIEKWKAKYAHVVGKDKNNKDIWAKKTPAVLADEFLKQEKRRLAHEVRYWYSNGAEVAKALDILGLVYTVETHDTICKSLIEHAVLPIKPPVE